MMTKEEKQAIFAIIMAMASIVVNVVNAVTLVRWYLQ